MSDPDAPKPEGNTMRPTDGGAAVVSSLFTTNMKMINIKIVITPSFHAAWKLNQICCLSLNELFFNV